MADNWDKDDFEPGEFKPEKDDQWEGEDEEDGGLKENWDDEEAEEDKEKNVESSADLSASAKKKKSVKQKILEREEQKKEEMLKKAELKKEMEENVEDDDDDEESIFGSTLDEKLRKQKLVEEADLEVTKDTFGIAASAEDGKKSIDTCKPTNKEEFTELAKMIVDKLSQFETSLEYPGFLEILIRDLATGIEAKEVKDLSSVLNVLASEKRKAQKVTKGKKKPLLGGGLKGTKGVDLSDYSTYGDECEDFM